MARFSNIVLVSLCATGSIAGQTQAAMDGIFAFDKWSLNKPHKPAILMQSRMGRMALHCSEIRRGLAGGVTIGSLPMCSRSVTFRVG